MAVNTTTNGGNTTVTFTYTSTTVKMSDTLTDAAHALYDDGYGDHNTPFASLTNQQKLDILDVFVRKQVLVKAKRYYIEQAEATAEATATSEAETKYI